MVALSSVLLENLKKGKESPKEEDGRGYILLENIGIWKLEYGVKE